MHEKLITPQDLIYSAFGRPTFDHHTAEGRCCLCGIHEGVYDRKRSIKTGFTDFAYLKAPESQAICPACASVFTEPLLKRKSWIVFPDRIEYLPRDVLWTLLFGWRSDETPFAIYITTSWKKHGSFKTRINYSWTKYYVQFEQVGLEFEPALWRAVGQTMELFYSIPKQEEHKKQPKSFFTKDQIRTGVYPQYRVRAFGLKAFEEAEGLLAPVRTQSAFPMLVFALNQQKLGKEATK